jgi:hypothetical protein
LNDAFGAQWSFDVVRYEIRDEIGEVIVLGKLTAGDIVKTQFGSSAITRTEDGGAVVSLGDDLKAAATNALKKAATLLGVGLHLYAEPAATQPQQGTDGADQAPAKQKRGFGPGVMGSRLSAKQHGYIMTLLKDSGMTKAELNDHCKRTYGVVVDHLSKADASALIEVLMKDGIRPPANGNGHGGGNGNGRAHRAAA